MKVIRKMAKRLIIQQPAGAVHLGYPRVIISYTALGIPPSPRLSLGHATHFQVGLFVYNTSNTFIIVSFIFSKDFRP